VERLSQSLKTKWGFIKHDVNKFVGTFGIVKVLCDYRNECKGHFAQGVVIVQNKAPLKCKLHFYTLLVGAKICATFW
jgi:hypothetical protein